MGRKGSWFSSIKKTLTPSSKEKKTQKSGKNGSVEEHISVPESSNLENGSGSCDSQPFPQSEDVKPIEVDIEPPAATGGTAASTATMTPYSGKSREEVAAIRIQTVYRGYSARKALWALRGLVRLKTVVEGPNVKRQTVNTLKCTQSLYHLQSQISSRRNRMSEDNQILQRQLLRAKEIANMQNGDEWNDSVQSKEETEAKLLGKYEAAMRRERAMAYSFSHQQPLKKSGGTTNMLFMDPINPQWGWSWSERYVARGEKDHGSVKSGIHITKIEIAKSYARNQLNSAPSTPQSKASGPGPVASRKSKPDPSPRAFGSGLEANPEDDTKSVVSVLSEKNRRHSVAGSMVPAKSAKVKTRVQGLSEKGAGGGGGGNAVAGSGRSAKKQLSSPRRHSGPPEVETIICNELE